MKSQHLTLLHVLVQFLHCEVMKMKVTQFYSILLFFFLKTWKNIEIYKLFIWILKSRCFKLEGLFLLWVSYNTLLFVRMRFHISDFILSWNILPLLEARCVLTLNLGLAEFFHEPRISARKTWKCGVGQGKKWASLRKGLANCGQVLLELEVQNLH